MINLFIAVCSTICLVSNINERRHAYCEITDQSHRREESGCTARTYPSSEAFRQTAAGTSAQTQEKRLSQSHLSGQTLLMWGKYQIDPYRRTESIVPQKGKTRTAIQRVHAGHLRHPQVPWRGTSHPRHASALNHPKEDADRLVEAGDEEKRVALGWTLVYRCWVSEGAVRKR